MVGIHVIELGVLFGLVLLGCLPGYSFPLSFSFKHEFERGFFAERHVVFLLYIPDISDQVNVASKLSFLHEDISFFSGILFCMFYTLF